MAVVSQGRFHCTCMYDVKDISVLTILVSVITFTLIFSDRSVMESVVALFQDVVSNTVLQKKKKKQDGNVKVITMISERNIISKLKIFLLYFFFNLQ